MEQPPRIPLSRPARVGTELGLLEAALAGGHLGGDGPFTRRSEAMLEAMLGGGRVMLTTSGTHALELAALLLDLRAGDEVVVPAFSFPSTAAAFALRGARPVFCDIRPDTLNLDESRLEGLLGARTRAVVPLHYAGIGCEMDAITATAARHHLVVVEDNALGLGARHHGRALGSLGALASLSFHETKAAGCGVGGALVVNDPRMVARAEVLATAAPTAPGCSAARSSATPGRRRARATPPPTSSPPSSAPSSRRSPRCWSGGGSPGTATGRRSGPGRRSGGWVCRTSRRAAPAATRCSRCASPIPGAARS